MASAKLVTPLLGFLLVLTGCSNSSDQPEVTRAEQCRKINVEVEMSQQRLKEIPATSGLVTDNPAFKVEAMYMSNLIVQNSDCFTPERVAQAQTALDLIAQQG